MVTAADTGDAPGDIGFLLSKKNLTQQCARDPTDFGCFLDGDNIYGGHAPAADYSDAGCRSIPGRD